MNSDALTVPTGLVEWKKEGLSFLRAPTEEEWLQVGRYVSMCRGASIRWLADWRRAGRRNFGDEAVEKAEAQLELEFKDLKAAASLEAVEYRRPTLTDEHHFVVSRIEDPKEQAKWLEIAEEEKLTPRDLAASVKQGAVVRYEQLQLNPGDKSAGLVTIEGISGHFDLWLKKVQADGFPQSWDHARLERVADYLSDMAQVHAQIKQILNS